MSRPGVARLLVSALLLATAPAARATDYFVDDVGGSDEQDGTAEARAWRTLAPVNGASFQPGDVVAFRRGGVWSGGLRIRSSGAPGAPITFTAYGTGGLPILEAATGDPWASCARVEGASHVVIEHLLLRAAPNAGIDVNAESSRVIVQGCELVDVGIGVNLRGTGHRVTGSSFHDLHMVRNTAGGDDDYGAVGVVLGGADHEIDHNRFERCIAPSYDYGTDGGAVEFWSTVTGCRVHHNTAIDTNGFTEIGGLAGDEVHDNVLAYNLAVDTRGFGYYHMSGTFGVDLAGLRIEHNTIVDRTDNWTIFGFGETPTAATASIRGNVVVTNGDRIANRDGFTHDHNVFWLTAGGQLGVTLGTGELQADPLFVNGTNGDFHLRPGSPGVDRGVDLGWTEDLDGRLVPQGAAPDLGAYELGPALAGDGGPPDATAAGGDGGTAGDDGGGSATPDGGAGGPDAAEAECDRCGGGCDCRIAPSSSPTLPPARAPALLAAAGLATALRRRRRRRGGT